MQQASSLDLFGGESPLPYQRTRATSRLAGERMEPKAPSLRRRVLDIIRDCGPITDDEIAALLELSSNSTRARRVELVRDGLVVSAGIGKSASGNPATTWRSTNQVARSSPPEPGIPAELWEKATSGRPSWMSRRQHEELIADAYKAEGNVEAALRRVVRDLEKLR